MAVKDPAAVCGNIWYHGTPEQRKAFGKGSEGRGRDEKPPKEWMDDCVAKIGTEGAAFSVPPQLTPQEQAVFTSNYFKLRAEGRSPKEAIAAALSMSAPVLVPPRGLEVLSSAPVGAGTFSVDPAMNPPERMVNIRGGNYYWRDTKDGYFTVYDVPIMTELKKGVKGAPKDIDLEELQHYVRVAQERYNSGKFAATCFKGHNSDIPISNPDFLGFVLPNRVGLHQMEDGPKWTIFADIKLTKAAFEKAKRGELPYHSPEVPWEKRRISGLAFLDTVPPYFEFPLFTIGEELPDIAYTSARSKFDGAVLDRAKFLEGGENMPPAHDPEIEKKDAEINLLKKMLAEAEAKIKKMLAEAEAKGSPKGKLEGEAEAKCSPKGKLEGEAEGEEKKKEEEEEKKKETAKMNVNEQVPPKGNPLPLEPNSKVQMMSNEIISMFAARDAKIAELEARLRKHDEAAAAREAEAKRAERVAKAKAELTGLILSEDIDKALATFADDEQKLATYVESLKKNAQRQPPTSLEDLKGLAVGASDPVISKFAAQGPDVLEKAKKYAAQYREMKRRGWPVTAKEEEYIEFNLKNPVA